MTARTLPTASCTRSRPSAHPTRRSSSKTWRRDRWPSCPAVIAADMEQSQVSILAVHVQRNELKSRMQLTDIVNRRKMRHGHMVNINRQMMLEGMRADFHKVDRLSQKVIDIVRTATEVRATTKGGSNFVATLNPDYKWIKTSGLISPDKWGNLPGGEVFTTPGNVDGTLVIDGVVGDFLCEKFGSLAATPLTLLVEGQSPGRGAQREQRARERFLELHPHRRELGSRGRVCDWHQHRADAGDRPHPAGREVSRHSRGLRRSLWRPHRRRRGPRRRTSTWWRRTSTSGWTDRQIMADGKFLIE